LSDSIIEKKEKPANLVIDTVPAIVKPEIVKPEIVKPETVKPEIVKPEIVKPEIVKPTTPVAPITPIIPATPPPSPVVTPAAKNDITSNVDMNGHANNLPKTKPTEIETKPKEIINDKPAANEFSNLQKPKNNIVAPKPKLRDATTDFLASESGQPRYFEKS
jgi:hypothetical protein